MNPGPTFGAVAASIEGLILDGMERDAYRVMVGGDAKLMDRLYRIAPARTAGFIAKQMRDSLAS